MYMFVQGSFDQFHTLDLVIDAFWLQKRTNSVVKADTWDVNKKKSVADKSFRITQRTVGNSRSNPSIDRQSTWRTMDRNPTL